MASRNTIRNDLPGAYYHVYARGINRQNIFLEPRDYYYFLSLFRRYLDNGQLLNLRNYETFDEKIEILAYCLMSNHFHLLVYQRDHGVLTALMRRIMSSYSRYFNQKYRRSGALFESRYKASLITSDDYLMHITRYIHLNPHSWRDYVYSSLAIYKGEAGETWVKPNRILELFSSPKRYFEFVQDYEDKKHELDDIKHQLANDT